MSQPDSPPQPLPQLSKARGLLASWRGAGAFIFRDYHLTRRYWTWIAVFTLYDVINAASIMLIGVAEGSARLTLTLILGAVMWSFLSRLFGEIAQSIAYERWEGTIEYTFMAPVSRLTHLIGVSGFAGLYALIRCLIVFAVLVSVTQVPASLEQMLSCLLIFLTASLGFMGLGLMCAVFPLMSTENGAQATNIVQAVFLIISGIYFPIAVLPGWLQALSALSPATYALEACRRILGIDHSGRQVLEGLGLGQVLPEMGILLLFGLVTIPAGLAVFGVAERWAKRNGKLKRVG